MTELIKQLEQQFAATKKELKFKATLDEIDEIFFIRDFVTEKGFLSQRFSRQLCGRITDLYNAVIGFLHGIVMPNPNNVLSMTEHQAFSEEQRAEVMQVMAKIAAFTSRNWLIGLSKDKKAEAAFIDEAVSLWSKEVKPNAIEFMTRINSEWKHRAATKPKIQKSEQAY